MPTAYLDFRKRVHRTLFRVSCLFLFVNIYATLGFMLIEAQPPIDAFFMAVITISTVGYGEVFPLSTGGRLFAVSSIFLGLLSSGIAVAMVTDLFVQGTWMNLFRERAKEVRLQKLTGHYIVCGYGTTGQGIARELLAQGDHIVVIDRNPVEEQYNMIAIVGDARRDEILREAGVLNARGLATTLTEDADNVFVVLSARSLNGQLKIVSRFKHGDTERKLEIAGVNHAISPYRIGGHRLAMALTNPPFLEVLDAGYQDSGLHVRFHHVKIPSGSRLSGKSLRESNLREHALGALVVAVIDRQNETVFNPSPDFPMDHAQQLLILGDAEQVGALRAFLST